MKRIVSLIIALVMILSLAGCDSSDYNKAQKLYDSGELESALEAYKALEEKGYKDSSEKVLQVTYDLGKAAFEAEDFETAKSYFKSIKEYKDSEDQIENCEYAILSKEIQIGNTITFGSYEQDNNKSNGSEKIEWLVLDKNDNNYLLISKYALDCQPYNTADTYETWEKSSLCAWLNDAFLNRAFSEKEQDRIAYVSPSPDLTPENSTDPGEVNKDKIFLLSQSEVNKYFQTANDKMCVPTDYAKAQGAWTNNNTKIDGKGTCCWWVRSTGEVLYLATFVFSDGSYIAISDGSFGRNDNAVRPALWIKTYS